ncbi:hypothetical protein CCR97_13555 [Rhodoplanes elegans]|uniref:Uncharacterized protein n=1 Tax=Rhodoplanes elegans TaxID=29408 RepID=A0A327KJT5_9BRAD|nr:DUF1178 family protein [Rhodoplanes elegans]MBK5959225.1 hypothetical protein [Rhodoplanes elegans]RAI38451.1 hypothetical protein CH338_12610 [Rhodoplanes elegans]
MIRYTLACRDGHAFESWFRNSADYDEQAARGLVACPVCGSPEVEKALMTPRLGRSAKLSPERMASVAAAAVAEIAGEVAKEAPAAAAAPAGSATSPVPAGTGVPDAAIDAKAPVALMPPQLMSPQEVALRRKLKELRDHLVQNAEHVGERFPDEARRMHYGEIEHRSIYGEASADDVKAMLDEGIEFHALPVLPDERN